MKRFLLLIILVILLEACAPSQFAPTATASATITATKTQPPTITPTLTATIISTPTITPTETPWPTTTPSSELTTHTWSTEPVLVYYNSWGGDGSWYPQPQNFVLYSDGQLFVWNVGFQGGPQYTSQLSRQEICALLNTIEQVGFFNYDHTTNNYEYFMGDGGGTVGVLVNAWETNSFHISDLYGIISSPRETNIEPSESLIIAKNTFKLLFGYKSDNLQPFVPKNIELWFYPPPYEYETTELWPEELPLLSELFEAAKQIEEIDEFGIENLRRLRLDGEAAYQISHTFIELPQRNLFSDGETSLVVTIIGLLPYPYPDPDPRAALSPSLYLNNTPPPTTLTCFPEDGLLAIPEP